MGKEAYSFLLLTHLTRLGRWEELRVDWIVSSCVSWGLDVGRWEVTGFGEGREVGLFQWGQEKKWEGGHLQARGRAADHTVTSASRMKITVCCWTQRGYPVVQARQTEKTGAHLSSDHSGPTLDGSHRLRSRGLPPGGSGGLHPPCPAPRHTCTPPPVAPPTLTPRPAPSASSGPAPMLSCTHTDPWVPR